MKSICLIDTSIFCELLLVPGRCSRSEAMVEEFAAKSQAGESMLLPVTTILETGNHIGQNGDGRQRRATAERFVQQVRLALQGNSPFKATPLFELKELLEWLGDFPNWAMRNDSRGKGSGLGDLTIVKLFEQQCALNPRRRVYIWSLDEHLRSFEQNPDR